MFLLAFLLHYILKRKFIILHLCISPDPFMTFAAAKVESIFLNIFLVLL